MPKMARIIPVEIPPAMILGIPAPSTSRPSTKKVIPKGRNFTGRGARGLDSGVVGGGGA
jgi:hypothetical protein